MSYSVTITNTSDRPFLADTPATVVDDLSGVLDDAEMVVEPTASVGSVRRIGERIVWSGPLASGASVTLRYGLHVTGEGDDEAANTAFAIGLPVDPATGLSTQPDAGLS